MGFGGTSKAELIRAAVRHELLGASADQRERSQRRARLLAAVGKLDNCTYPAGYLGELRDEWRGPDIGRAWPDRTVPR